MRAAGPRLRGWYFLFVAAGGAFAVLLWPTGTPSVGTPSELTAFRWDADGLFAELEAEFARASRDGAGDAAVAVDALLAEGTALLATLEGESAAPLAALDSLATLQLRLAVRGAARPTLLPRVLDFVVRARVAVMHAAASWPLDRATHEALYRVVFGGRIALDEALAQVGAGALPELVTFEDVPSATPSIVVEGVRVHSGDILLSRGGAPTSALIARGNDFPNTFSHAALAHVHAETGEGTVIEALIEAGSVLSTVSAYLESKKHRILVLRLRPDHPSLAGDPLLPHRAAESMLARVRAGHIPYDFAMAWRDETAAFCSEIIYHAYREQDVELWGLKASMSAPGLVRWLADMGVREFTTLVPSDLEYDPQVRAVVEWRNAPTLMDFRLDNAITDALLEEAERGAHLGYAWYALPAARLVKTYSLGQSVLGATPTIPNGMSAATALRVDALVSTIHPVVKEELVARTAAFRATIGYEAPYWTLVQLAREALAARTPSLAPSLAAR
ncbi:MAG TPA: YiiX/YebB-like N1pC/P60 family cysteine hydrolase [Longimicrobiales bacterium]|nr:YiiX/YebB-like N1pC/P60 family cysteine hydrolase [Longimicrobiales bacterium]